MEGGREEMAEVRKGGMSWQLQNSEAVLLARFFSQRNALLSQPLGPSSPFLFPSFLPLHHPTPRGFTMTFFGSFF